MKGHKYYEVNSEEEARETLAVEANNWTWLSREQKEELVANADVNRTDTKYGPVFQVIYEKGN